MNLYIKWTLKSLVSTVLLIALLAALNYNFAFPALYNVNNFAVHAKASTLIAGASHSQTAFNPALIKDSYSIAQAGENFFYTYYKLKRILPQNPQIKTVLMAFSPSHICRYHENTLFNQTETLNYFGVYFPVLDSKAKQFLQAPTRAWIVNTLKFDFGVPFDIIKDAKMYISLSLGRFRPTMYPFWGGYYSSDKNNLSKKFIDKKAKLYFTFKGKPSDESRLMIEYFQKIGAFCAERKINLVLIGTPIYKGFFEKIPDHIMASYKKVATHIVMIYPSCSYFDFIHYPLPDNCRGDGDHINATGAVRFAPLVNKLLSHGYKKPN